MNVHSVPDLIHRDRAIYEISESGGIVLKHPQKFISQTLDLLVWNSVFGESNELRQPRGGLSGVRAWSWASFPPRFRAYMKPEGEMKSLGLRCRRSTSAA